MKKLFLIAGLSFSALVFPQGKNNSSVSMPSVSMPSIGSGHYGPGSSDFYGPSSSSNFNTTKAPTAPTAPTVKNNTKTPAADSSKTTTTVSKQVSSGGSSSIKKIETATPKTNPLPDSEFLTANDISSLGNLGYFRNLTGLLGMSRSQSMNSNTVDLDAVLNELNDLKSRVDEKDRSEDVQKASFSTTSQSVSKILRFSINNYDLTKTMKTVYFSREESDGTFLLTGDRVYYADGGNRNETFYILFKNIGGEDGITKYKVSSSVNQDYENPNSYLAKFSVLSENEELFANRTGNLVTMKINGSDLKMDLLLGLEK